MRRLAAIVPAFPELNLEELDTSGLEARDAALAHAIMDCVLRRWMTLEHLIQSRLDRQIAAVEPAVRGALLAGAAQLLLLDRVPPHAAIFETVEWVKREAKKEAAGFVNGVLRAVLRLVAVNESPDREIAEKKKRETWQGAADEIPLVGGGALALAIRLMPTEESHLLAVATSHPLWLVRKWKAAFGAEARTLLLHSLAPAPVVLNTAFAGGDIPASCVAHPMEGSHVYEGGREDLVRLLRERKDVWVQDAASTQVVRSLGDRRAVKIVDLCAGMGTKTRQLAMQFPGAEVIASDPDPGRSRSLKQIAGMYGNVRVVSTEEVSRAGQGADIVLADVPCTNTGVLARRVEAKYRCDDRQLARLGAIQREILTQAAALVRPGGVLAYATCSVEREENEDQAQWTGRTLGARVVREHRQMPRSEGGYCDGSFHFLAERG